MTDADAESAEQQLALHDTIAWDEVYARACRQTTDMGFAQLILEHRPADYALVNGRDPNALNIEHFGGAKLHAILGWAR